MPSKAAKSKDRTTAVGRDLETVHRFTLDLLAQHGLDDWSVYWVRSLEKTDGGGATFCHARRILFSAAHVALFTPAERRDAVRHEVAHALVGVASEHSQEWKLKAVELGGSGTKSQTVSWRLYPWYGLCPDEHGFVSVTPPGPDGFLCTDKTHEQPVKLEWWKKNPRSPALDPGVIRIVEKHPEPPSEPGFAVGDTVYVVPYGADRFDNAPLVVLEVGERDYLTRHADTGEEILVRHEMVGAARKL
ncbi:hypothetical protein [Cellulosimicrobium sp. SL-1]|uniref:hypothetical protein n=1 Tax=Cellulosimicrobium sp. SL-1 TaxID=2699423 RepID=UPI0013D2EAFD|nr:hypothetical protein [Cellulosimicrobium sp. SL-1]